MDINDIGSIDPTALLCNTDRGQGGSGDSGGDWFAPDGTTVGNSVNNRVPGFVRNRGSMVVRLLRDTGTDPAAEGIFRSSILDAEGNNQIVFVGLYNTGNGSLRTFVVKFTLIATPFCRRYYSRVIDIGWSQSSVHPHLYLHWWTCYHCPMDQRQ